MNCMHNADPHKQLPRASLSYKVPNNLFYMVDNVWAVFGADSNDNGKLICFLFGLAKWSVFFKFWQ